MKKESMKKWGRGLCIAGCLALLLTLWYGMATMESHAEEIEGQQEETDTVAPVLEVKADNSAQKWQTTSDDRTWYLAQCYELTGRCTDAQGNADIEYSTDGGGQWTRLETQEGEFALTLGNGTYTGIVLRAIDEAGNCSEEYRVTNQAQEDITVVVDDRTPVADIAVTGTQEWTNQPVGYQVRENAASPLLYRTYYQYVPVWQVRERAMAGETPYADEDWQELPALGLRIGTEEPVNQNGIFYFKAISMCGLESEVTSRHLRMQQTFPELMPAQITNDLGEAWYNAKSARPVMTFSYEDYTEGRVDEGEYQAPLTLHRILTTADGSEERTLTVGFTCMEEYEAYCAGERIDYEEKAAALTVDFADMADGIYEVSYWIDDAAGNRSETVTRLFRIDTESPTGLCVTLNGATYEANQPQSILYDTFSRETIHAAAAAEDALSGIASVRLLAAKRIGEWSGSFAEGSLDITAGTKCFLYVIACDEAGNEAETWTNGIVVDNEAPIGVNGAQMLVTPSGANANGFYNQDVAVSLQLRDMPGGDNASGLAQISCRIVSDQADETRTLCHNAESALSEEQLSASYSFETEEIINAARFEGNDVRITVTARDRAGNEAMGEETLQIDVTKPLVSISFEEATSANGVYYSETRTAWIIINERNFDAQRVSIEVIRDGEPYQMNPGSWQSEGSEHRAALYFAEDGEYTLAVKCTDQADNESETVSVEPFTIDCTAPTLEVSYEGASAFRDGYYNGMREAVLTVTERNFDEDSFRMITEQPYVMGAWTHEGDEHRVRICFAQQGEYQWSCSAADLALNSSVNLDMQKFTIDMEKPAVIITGVTNNSANAGDIFPKISIHDTCYDMQGVQIALENGDGERCEITPLTQTQEDGYCYSLPQINELPDQVYYLTVFVRDLAGNETKVCYRFSLNRNGSAYDMRMAREATGAVYYNYEQMADIVLVEMNVDKVERFSLYVTRNGALMPSREVTDRQRADTDMVCYRSECEGDERRGYCYTYTLYRESFAEEGVYQIGFYSRDAAGNEASNTLAVKDAELRFLVDNTSPKAVFDGIEDGGVYNAENRQVNVRFSDNAQLSTAYLYLSDEQGNVLEQWDYMALANETGLAITIPEYDGVQSLQCAAIDAAGNELSAQRDCVISTNTWVRLQRGNMVLPLIGGATVLIAAAALGGCFLTRKFFGGIRRRTDA